MSQHDDGQGQGGVSLSPAARLQRLAERLVQQQRLVQQAERELAAVQRSLDARTQAYQDTAKALGACVGANNPERWFLVESQIVRVVYFVGSPALVAIRPVEPPQ